jgi:nitroreductase
MAEPSPTTPLSMPLEEAMRTQRAIRRLKPDPVDDALVLHLIELALRAPTGSNAQNWQFVVVKDQAVKARLGRMNRQAWRLYGGIGRRMAQNDPPMLRIIEAVQGQADHFEEIPVLVVACLATMIPILPRVAATSLYGSIFPSVQNLLLAARAAGLGAARQGARPTRPPRNRPYPHRYRLAGIARVRPHRQDRRARADHRRRQYSHGLLPVIAAPGWKGH